MGNRVTADVTEYADAWVDNAYARRQWGLVADQRPSTHPVAGNGAVDASAALQDFDGISYAKGSRDPAPAQRHARRRGVLQGRHRPLRAAPLRQRHDARPLRELGARRRRRPVGLHRQLAAHRRPGPDRARPRGRRRPPYAARGPPGRPAAPHPRGRRGDRRDLDRPRAGDRGPGDAVRRRRPAGAARPLQRHLGAADPRQADHGRAREPAPPHHRSRAPRRALEQRPQRAAQRRRRPGRRARARGREPAGRGHRGQPRAARWPGSTAGWCRCSPTPAAALAELHAAARGQARRPPRRPRRSSSRRSGPRSRTCDRPRRAARLAGGHRTARRRPARPRPALAGAGPARHAGRGRPGRAGPSARRRARRGAPGSRHAGARASLPERRGQGLGLVVLHR